MKVSGDFLKDFLKNLWVYFIGVSIVGLFFLVLMVFSVPPSKVTILASKTFIFSIFILICFLGIMAGIFPSKCFRIIQSEKNVQNDGYNKRKEDMDGEKPIKLRGHHPDCGNFSEHVFQLRGKTYCAGCTGLVIGAIISILGAFMYMIDASFLGENGIIFWLGFIGVLSGLFQGLWLNLRWNLLHLFFNLFFVLGAFLLLVGIDKITGNLFIEFYFLGLTVFWILTRIVLSQRKHEKICASCGFESCSFF
ncbi:MAG: restriction endonuclease [Euryarchaeota archaeon]|nr:restriction endonuclease [Euryarchaeota archaeon]